MPSRSFGVSSRREGPPSIWDTHGISGNVFVHLDVSSSAPCPQELDQWSSSIEESLHSSTVERSERQKQNQDLRCQSGPSAKNSLIFSGDSSKNSEQTNNDCRFRIFVSTNSLHQPRFLAGRKDSRLRNVLEVELVDSVDDLKSSSSTRGLSMPNFEVLGPCTSNLCLLEDKVQD